VSDLFAATETLQTRQSWSSSDQWWIHGGWGISGGYNVVSLDWREI